MTNTRAAAQLFSITTMLPLTCQRKQA